LQRKVDGDFSVTIQTILFYVSHDAGNYNRLFRIEPEVLADRITARPETFREFFVDDRDLLTAL
jgi:hypothetical protein